MQRVRNQLPPMYMVITLIVGLSFAFFLGKIAGEGDFKKLLLILFSIGGIGICLKMQKHIWLTIPFLSGLPGALSFLPLPFSLGQSATIAVFGMFIFFIIFKKLRTKFYYEYVDVVLLINLLYLVFAYIKNPVGIEAMGAERVGGGPYLVIIISVLGYWVYNHVRIEGSFVFKYVLISLSGHILQAGLTFITNAFPSTAVLIYPFYTGVNFQPVVENYSSRADMNTVDDAEMRAPYSDMGTQLYRVLLGYFNPMTLISPLYFGRFLMLCFSAFTILTGGYRTLAINSALCFVVVCYIKGGSELAFRSALIGLGILGVLICSQGTLIELPFGIQRSLCFLPGNWNERAVMDAQGSSQWRYDMWAEVTESDKWIKDWWFGDGFGFSKEQLNLMRGEILGDENATVGTESQKIQGSFHNGPLSAIRFVGILGLILYIWLLGSMAKYGWRLIHKCKNTPYFPLAIAVCVPALWEPINFIFVFGAYNASVPENIGVLAIMKLISASLREHLEANPPPPPELEVARFPRNAGRVLSPVG